MLPLRYAHFWAAVPWLGVALAIFLTVLPPAAAPVPIGGRAQHIAGYFILTLWLTGIHSRRRYPLIGGGLLLFGGAMEFLQLLSPTRHPTFADALTNGVGIGLALAMAYAGLGGWAMRVERLLGAA